MKEDLTLDRRDQEAIEAAVGERLGLPLKVEEGRRMSAGSASVLFRAHETGPGRRLQYHARVVPASGTGTWELEDLSLHGELDLSGHAGPVRIAGDVEVDEAEEILVHLRRYCQCHADLSDLQLQLITSSRRAGIGPAAGNSWPRYYQLHLRSDDLRAPPPPARPPGQGPRAVIGIRSNIDGSFSFRLERRDAESPLEVVAVEALGDAARHDPRILDALQAGLEKPPAPGESAALERAIRAALPPAFAGLGIRSLNRGLGAGEDQVNVQVEELEPSPKRRIRSLVHCSRPLDGSAPWRCRHRIFQMIQQLPGPVLAFCSFTDELSEQEVEHVAERLGEAQGEPLRGMLRLELVPEGFKAHFGTRQGMRTAVLDRSLTVLRIDP